MQLSFPIKLKQNIRKKSGLCVGFDPSPELLRSWGLEDNLNGLQRYMTWMTKACIKADIGFVKPQSAFYERFGWQGLQILSEHTVTLRRANIIVIFDGKRGDINSTASAYADAYLSETNFNKYDAITLNPFLGYDSLQPFINKIRIEPVGIFIVVRSSNPGAELFQEAKLTSLVTISDYLSEHIRKDNELIFGSNQMGSVGAVIGSTLNNVTELAEKMPTSFFLCPGVGAQGETLESAYRKFFPFSLQCIFPVSRGLSLNIQSENQLLDNIMRSKNILLELEKK